MINFKFDYSSFFLNASLNIFFIIIGIYFFLNQDSIFEDQFGRALILMSLTPIFIFLLINLTIKAYNAPKNITIDTSSNLLIIKDNKFNLKDMKCIDFIYKHKRIFLMVINEKNEVILNAKTNYLCNRTINEINEITSKIEVASIYYR